MSAFDDLMMFTRETEALGAIMGRLNWDQETMMPRGAAEQRGEEFAALESVLHARKTDARIGGWLEQVDAEALDEVSRAQLRHIRRSYERNTKVPARLAAELAKVTSVAQGIWAEARARDDFAHFAPTFKEVVRLRREEAAALKEGTDYDLWDALHQDYEPGSTGAQLDAMFGALRPRLVALRDKIMGADQPKGLSGTYDEAKQMALTEGLAAAFGYDFAYGRIDKAVHPFSSGSGLDVRITTRTNPEDPLNSIYSTIHETGHACYEQNISRDYLLTPLGEGVSMGVHESQSRIYENQLGRSRAFTEYLYGEMRETFGEIGVNSAEDFYAAVNRLTPGYIRTESDEVQYNLHVLLRFDLERQIIGGSLDIDDLPEAWDSRFEADFGVKVDKVSNGCLQDVHWPVGLFGYFPTYSLGNVYAGCLYKALRGEVSDLDAQLAKGDTSAATGWLKDNLQQFGGLREPRDTIVHACGFEPSEAPLLDYLEEKFAGIYGF
ncbi:carboxypeptidase M32 [Celeribacter halophilus]|uniref:Metal-dependent carboxypeptidase n=1 Tax=Celeribacter halophilus TaxID=576117 RepID=A0AAW7XMJ3_9RHOB|nr:carboxypeptidase M32 [Celeribacter halophilus]MDO6455492.1 carboxypeptidase M32 [Celeribacter halophilus]MDO6721696.1 carboxypeptidase M32 [Celeribacter halophilus]